MDNAGYQARHRAERQAQSYAHPMRSPDGHMQGVETVNPLNAAYKPLELGSVISHKNENTNAHGGLTNGHSAVDGSAHQNQIPNGNSESLGFPNGDESVQGKHYTQSVIQSTEASIAGPRSAPQEYLQGNVFPAASAIPASASQSSIHDSTQPRPQKDVQEPEGVQTQISEAPRKEGTGLMPPEPLGWVPELGEEGRMQPHLQLMCGPMLSYYTTKDGVWQGGALVVTADAGSQYDPSPSLSLRFSTSSHAVASADTTTTSQLKPHSLSAQQIYNYKGPAGTYTFWRFIIELPLQVDETHVGYRLNNGVEKEFYIPAVGQNLRWAAHSCNGFSAGIDPNDFRAEKFTSGFDPVWCDLLDKHKQKPFHCMVGGGDQIYCDSLTREPELQEWINAPDRKSKIGFPLTEELKLAVDRFYFSHYCNVFRSNAFGRANSSIPMVNMLDDHDLIDGFGTYDDETQAAPVFSYIGSRGYFWYLLFQVFVVDAVDGVNKTPGTHPIKSVIIGGDGAWIPFPAHSLLVYLGPKVQLLALDCRAERKLRQICSKEHYERAFGEVRKVPSTTEQLVVLLGVPVAYPRMAFAEHFLDKKWNPLNVLARRGLLGLGGMVNKFNQASELLDDLNDHWCANVHKKERNWLVNALQILALEKKWRVTFLSGDVHVAAVGVLFTYGKKGKPTPPPGQDPRYMLNVITSAIVNTPPPPGAAAMVAFLAGNKHRTLRQGTDESMVPLFGIDTDGQTAKKKYIQPKRNYAQVDYNTQSGDLTFDIRVEKQRGGGDTKRSMFKCITCSNFPTVAVPSCLQLPFEVPNDMFTTNLPAPEQVEDVLLSCRYGELEELEAFAKDFGWDAVTAARDERGNTVLHMACGNGHLPVLQILLEKTPTSLIGTNNEAGTPPLHWAISNNHIDCVKALVELPEEQGGGLPILKVRNASKRDAFMEAIWAGEGKEEVAGWIEGYLDRAEGGEEGGEEIRMSAGDVTAQEEAEAVEELAEKTEALNVEQK